MRNDGNSTSTRTNTSTNTRTSNDSRTNQSSDTDRSSKPFYGDLVRAAAFTVIVPVSAYDVIKTKACDADSEQTVCNSALFTVFLVTLTCCLNWLSYIRHSNSISSVGFLAALWVCAFINLNQWPYSGECVITNMFQGALFGNLCNGSLSFRNHLVRMALMFAVASYVSIKSPFSVYHEDVLPLLGGPMLMAISFLAATRLDWTFPEDINWNLLTVQGSQWVLAAIYMYHAASEFLSMTFEGVGAERIFSTIVKAGIVASMGVVATGTFQKEIDMNAQLEVMVKTRTKTIQEKNDKLHMVELALECSETAIAITDSDLRIIWLNAACEDISTSIKAKDVQGENGNNSNININNSINNNNNNGEVTETKEQPVPHRKIILGRPIAEVIALETIIDEKKLTEAFSKSRKEDEICINRMMFRLEVSPYEYSSPTTEKGSGGAHNDRSNRNRNSNSNSNIYNNDNDNDSSTFLVVLKNITAERAREVAEKSAQEEAMLAKAMGDSMLTLTHELRTPMQGIMGVTGMLLQQKHDADKVLVESLKLIMASSGLLLNLINNLLDVKKVNSEMMDDFPMSPVIATSAIRDTIDFCQPLASISGVSVVPEYGEDRGFDYNVVSNPLRLQQVLINLVSNAIKYTSEQSKIKITIQPTIMTEVELQMKGSLASSRDCSSKKIDGNAVKDPLHSSTPVLVFSISDCGPGIAPHQADRLFRRFARLDSKPSRALGGSNKVGQPSGTGLGLNLCQLFLQRMNGEIWAINNSNGKGSTFSFFLPLAADSIINPQIAAPLSVSKRRPSFEDLELSTTQLKVLLVDDVLINRKVIGRMVKLLGVSDIVTADSGESALIELSENGPYDLVITDLQMPGISGTELCEAIMSGKTCPMNQLPVVVGLTADTSSKVAENCRASGMSNVLYKPISVIEMREFFETSVMLLRPGVWFTGRGKSTVLCAQ